MILLNGIHFLFLCKNFKSHTPHGLSNPPEPQLLNKRRRYRGAHLLGRFEVICFYVSKAGRVYIVRLWDMRRNPEIMAKGMR